MFVLRFPKIMLSFLSMDSGSEGCVFYWTKCTVLTAIPANCSVEETVQRDTDAAGGLSFTRRWMETAKYSFYTNDGEYMSQGIIPLWV